MKTFAIGPTKRPSQLLPAAELNPTHRKKRDEWGTQTITSLR